VTTETLREDGCMNLDVHGINKQEQNAIPQRICLYRKHLYSKRGFAINKSCVYQFTEHQSRDS